VATKKVRASAKRTTQPQYPSRLNLTNALAKSIVGYWTPAVRADVTARNDPQQIVGKQGKGLIFVKASTQSVTVPLSTPIILTNTGASILTICFTTNSAIKGSFVAIGNNSNYFSALLRGDNGFGVTSATWDGTNYGQWSSTPLTNNEVGVYVITINAANTQGKVYKNGVDVTTTQTNVGVLSTASLPLLIVAAANVGGGDHLDGGVYLAVAFNKVLSPSEVSALSRNPWQIFQQNPAKSSLVLNATAAAIGDAFQANAFQTNAFQTTATTGITATLAATLDSVTVASTGTVGHPAALIATLDSVTVAASATAGHPTSLAVTLDSVTVAASATAGHPTSLAVTLDSVTVAASATAGHPTSLAVTLDSVTVAVSATAGHPATLTATLDSIAFAAAATTTSGITATMAVTLDSVAFASSSTVGHPTTLAVTLDSVAASFAATTGHSANLAVTLDTVAVASVATVGHPATLAITLDDIVFAAAATTAHSITANIAFTLDGVLYNSAIVSGHSATIAFALDDISVNITAVNSNPGPITGYVETLLVLRTFTDRKRF
jgi:hypothetical protein